MAGSFVLGPYKDSRTPNRRHGLPRFEIAFGHPGPTGISKPPTGGLSGTYGTLSEQFDTLTSYTHELTSILEAYTNR